MQFGDVLLRASRALRAVRHPDVVCISNWRNERDMQTANVSSPPGHAWGQPIAWNGVKGHLLVIGITSDELGTPQGKRRMKSLFHEVVAHNAREGRVFLAAAGTKTAMKNPETLKIVRDRGAMITEGNTMTSLLLQATVAEVTRRTMWHPDSTSIAVLGAKGRLGRSVTDLFVRQGFNVIEVTRRMDLDISQITCSNLGVIVCTHAFRGRVIGSPQISRVAILDVAEPKGGGHLFKTFKNMATASNHPDMMVRWLGVGYAYHPKLHILFRHLLELPRGVVFGCFAEALSWGKWVLNGGNVDGRVIEIGGGHDDVVRAMLEAYKWVPHAYLIGTHGI